MGACARIIPNSAYMKTERYDSEYLSRAVELLRAAQNAVVPTAQFSALSELVDGDAEKLNKLLRGAYTVVALENDEPIGLASLDKSGRIALVAIDGGAPFDKTAKTLLRALERRAVKKELPELSVSPTTVKDVCVELGYAPTEADASVFTKRAVDKSAVDLPPERVKRIELDPNAPIGIEGKSSVFPVVLFAVACFFVMLWTILFFTVGMNEPGGVDGKYFILLAVVCAIFVAALAIFITHFVKRAALHKEIRAMSVTNGIVTDVSANTYHVRRDKNDTERYTNIAVWYIFYDADMRKHKAVYRHKYKGNGAYFYVGQELVVAYSDNTSYILNRYTAVSRDAAEPTGETESDETAKPKKAAVKDPSELVPFGAVKWNMLFAIVLFAVVIIADGALLLFCGISAAEKSTPLWNELRFMLPFIIVVFVGFGGWASIYAVRSIKARSEYRAVLRNGATFVRGRLLCTEKTFDAKNKPKFYCEFVTTSGEKRKKKVPNMLASRLVMHGDTDVTVAYAGSAAVVLVPKDCYINKIVLR